MNTEQELNKKLAEWAGFIPFTQVGMEGEYAPPEGVKVVWTTFKPKFTRSLDQCFKWLVPKVIGNAEFSVIVTQDLAQCSGYVRPLQFGRQYDAVDNSNPALALCLAIEKLIDSEVK